VEQLWVVGPLVAVGALAIALLFAEFVFGPRGRLALLGVTVAGLTLSGIWASRAFGLDKVVFSGAYRVDSLTAFVSVLLVAVNILVLLAAYRQGAAEGLGGDFYALMAFSIFGGMVMAGANNLIMIYLGIELVTLPCYVLVSLRRDDRRAAEAALKYFLLAILTSVVMTYGMSLLYGLTGEIGFDAMAGAITAEGLAGSPLFILAVALVSAGFSFKLAAAPFHFWAPDAYEGASTPVTAFISAVPKFGALAGVIRVFQVALSGAHAEWTTLFVIIAVLSMLAGNLMAYQQRNIKRLLAYSSIAHAGYLFVALAAGTELASASVLFYITVYAAANLGAFFVVIAASGEELDDLGGLASRSPFLAASMLVFLLSLTGIPPLAGFMGKLFIFGAAIEGGLGWLALVGVLNSVVSLGYYALIIKEMYMASPSGVSVGSSDTGAVAATSACLVLVGVLGIFPNAVMALLTG